MLGGLFHKGHGLSIGSLGERHTEQSVEDVLLANVRFYRTSNAARVKTWQGGRGRVRNVTFSNLDVRGVYRPLVLDQFYCPESASRSLCERDGRRRGVGRESVRYRRMANVRRRRDAPLLAIEAVRRRRDGDRCEERARLLERRPVPERRAPSRRRLRRRRQHARLPARHRAADDGGVGRRALRSYECASLMMGCSVCV